MTEFTVVKIDRDAAGNVLSKRTITGPSIEDALAASQIKDLNWDGHGIKEALRTQEGADLKSFCNLKFKIVIGEEASPERAEYMRVSSLPITCWKCNDRKMTT